MPAPPDLHSTLPGAHRTKTVKIDRVTTTINATNPISVLWVPCDVKPSQALTVTMDTLSSREEYAMRFTHCASAN